MKRFVVLLLISFFAFSGSYVGAFAQENVTNNESAARDIMGDDIIFPEEVAKARGLSYTEAQLKQLSDTVPKAEVLRWGKEKGYVLMPAPPKAMSFLDVHKLKDDHINSEYSNYDGQAFSRNDKTTFGWLMIKKTPVDGSTSKNWDEQNMLLSRVERVPNVAEMSWFIATFYDVRGIRLFDWKYVRTSSLVSGGIHVYVGHFDAEGLDVDYYHEILLLPVLGVASARKLP